MHVSTTRDISYLHNFCCRIRAPMDHVTRAVANFESHPIDLPRGRLGVVACAAMADFLPVCDVPYLRVAVNTERHAPGFDYLRYGTLARTIWRPTRRSFLIRSGIFRDEMSILECYRDLFFLDPGSDSLALVHASLVALRSAAFLIVGGCRSGKTTFVSRFLSEIPEATFVADGLCLIEHSNSDLLGHYLPRRIYVRFGVLFNCERLRVFGENIDRCDATQVLDSSTISRIMKKRLRDVDLSITIARSRFAAAFGAKSLSSARIAHVITPEYNGSPTVSYEQLSSLAVENVVRRHEFPKRLRFGRIERQSDVRPPTRSVIQTRWFEGIEGTRILHGGWRTFSRSAMEDLISRLSEYK